jgi:hypothetical protein
MQPPIPKAGAPLFRASCERVGDAASILLITLLTACGYPGIPRKPSLDLPIPPTDLQAIRKSDKVYLSWTVPTRTADRLIVKHLGPTRVCRTLNSTPTECGTPVGEVPPTEVAPVMSKNKRPVPPKRTAEFIDTIPSQPIASASGQFTYAVEAQNQRRRSAGLSNLVEIPAVPTLPAPSGLNAQATADGVLLTWTPTTPPSIPGLTFKYRIYRREGTSPQDTLAGEAALDTPQLLDRTIEWEKVYSYRVTVVTVVNPPGKPAAEVEGDDSPAVQLLAHDVFPPAVPSGLQAVFSGVGQQPFVDLVWTPDTAADLAGYNIYRREENGQPMKISSELVKTPAYRDTSVASGKTYFYSISAADIRGNESPRSPEASETVP